MIPAKNRLKSVFNRGFGPFSKGRFLNIKSKINNLGYNRFAVLVSKKYSLKATSRNEIKRKIFRFLAKNKSLANNFKNSRDFLIIVLTNEGSARDNDQTLELDLETILTDLK